MLVNLELVTNVIEPFASLASEMNKHELWILRKSQPVLVHVCTLKRPKHPHMYSNIWSALGHTAHVNSTDYSKRIQWDKNHASKDQVLIPHTTDTSSRNRKPSARWEINWATGQPANGPSSSKPRLESWRELATDKRQWKSWNVHVPYLVPWVPGLSEDRVYLGCSLMKRRWSSVSYSVCTVCLRVPHYSSQQPSQRQPYCHPLADIVTKRSAAW